MLDLNYLAEEYVKCYSDKTRIYMIEHFLKTYDATQKKEVQYMLFPRQKDLCNALGTGNNVVTTKPRQAGITTTCGGFISCEIVLASKDEPLTILVIGNTLDLAQQMVKKIRDFLYNFLLGFGEMNILKKVKIQHYHLQKNSYLIFVIQKSWF